VNKADGEFLSIARVSAAAYRRAADLQRNRHSRDIWRTEVCTCSAFTGDGVAEVWELTQRFRAAMDAGGHVDKIIYLFTFLENFCCFI
jgi:putative protein kinase ArgK-like GTPase of G3E family